MFHSVRARLTLWYTAILALVLITFSAISYALLAQATRSATDSSLTETGHEFVRSFSNEPADYVGPGRSVLLDLRYSDRDVILFSPSGSIIAASHPHLNAAERSTITTLVRAGATGLHTVEGGEEGDGVRLIAVPVQAGGSQYVAIVAQDLDAEADRLESARHAVFFGIPLALLVAAGGGYLLARKSLAPVAAMSAKARVIGAETLDERIAIENERDELGHLASTLNDLLERLQRAFVSQRRFMADASHELRTPVSIIQGEADVTLSREDRSPAEYRESLALIQKSTRKLTRIVQDLFLLARSDVGTYPIDRSRFYLDELLADSVRAMRSVASAKDVELHCESASDMVMTADEALVQRMFLNLLDNAVKFTSSGGRVAVSAARHDHTYTIRVKDTGPVVKAEDRERIFERFYRGDPSRRAQTGAGLGLPIARWIAELHGGRVDLEESEPPGNTFRVTLPAE